MSTPALEAVSTRCLLGIAAVAGIVVLVGCGDSGPNSADRSYAPEAKALMDCSGEPQVEPRTVVLACADFWFQARDLRWTGWGEPRAHGSGLAFNKICEPSCAESRAYVHTRIVLVASGEQTCDGRSAYRGVTYAFVGQSPYPPDAPGTEQPWQAFGCGGI